MDKLIGIGLYRKDQWPLLLESADDISAGKIKRSNGRGINRNVR